MSGLSAFSVLVLLFLLSFDFSFVQGCPPHEVKALLRFRSSVNDSYLLESWKGDECCTWDGIKCDGIHVSKLDLEGYGLTSVSEGIDSSLFELKHLNYLSLRDNSFSGEIPSQLGSLSSLRYLDLSFNAFHGEIPFQLGGLSSLRHLDLRSNDFSLTSFNIHCLSNLSSLEYLSLRDVKVSDKSWGSIIGSLLHLKHLDLYNCSPPLSIIPSTLFKLSSLTFLDLSYNYLIGQIPLSVGHNLGSLYHLSLWENNLEGTIPPSLGLLMNLTYLDLGSNQLRGNIPANFGNLHKLRFLYLDNNQLNGNLPLSFAHISSLHTLYLSENYINGTISGVFFQKLFKLETLSLSYSGLRINISSTWIPSFQLRVLLLRKCQIGGPIPSWISTQFNLGTLDLSVNQLVGNLSSWLWDIDEVHLSDNHLEGSFNPISRSLRYLDLSMNELSGHLPADIHLHLPNIEILILANNKFKGKIPTSIAHLRNLYYLDMSNNHLTGNVPATLGNVTSLLALNLENNFLKGEISKELGSLLNLQSLCIGKNKLQGILPPFLTKFSRLKVLDVGENDLIGNVPHWIANFSNLHVLVMRSNNFEGKLPLEIGGMPKLQVLDLSSNLISGVIPHAYFLLPAMKNSSIDGSHLEISQETFFAYSDTVDLIIEGNELHYEDILSSLTCFDLSNNRLTGHILSEIENLKGLMYLNLSRNNLNGSIPESLGCMRQLESVDLSCNNFSGRIPWQIGSLNHLAHLNLSYNHLYGSIPQEGGRMITFDESSYIGNPNLWGCPLQRNCFRPLERATPPPVVGVMEKTEEGFQFSWYWMFIGLSAGVGFSTVVVVLMLKPIWRTKCFQAMDKVIEMMDKVICMLPKPKLKPLW